MAGSNLRKFKNPEVLRKFSFQRLLEMVGRYKGYFDRMQFQIEGATEETFDYDRLAEILSNQMFVGEYEELFNGFALVGATSMECFNDILRTFISRSSYAGELTDTMSTADMALLVYLHDPEELSVLETDYAALKKKSFAMRATRRDIRNLVITPAQIRDFEEGMNLIFQSKNYGNTARVTLTENDSRELVLLVRHGDSYRRQGIVMNGRKSKTIGFQPESYNTLSINRDTGELRLGIPTSPKWMEDAYCRQLGKSLFNDYDAFSAPRINDLDKIRELGRNILVYHGAAEVKSISLLSIKAFLSGDSGMCAILEADNGDLFRDMERHHFKLSSMGRIIRAKFLVKIGRSERTIILDASNRSGYDYDDFGMVVDEWLRQVGVIHTLMQNDEAIHVELLADECKIAAAV
ncbi:hypothetical protein FYJ85_21915 [Victivallaceae bacterium BBE-744-WT-12]|uniref:Uncharacterized protein n=1 Tax=Victivallis lenta TaxID=2606640 RepID=A0A844GAZ9_9BACT|nr:hypothetical protein [Victivallis lenta]MST99691.1 hypothetical protein [Victivallis lenta]